MSKLDYAVTLLKAMPIEQQDIAADALLDFVADDRTLQLSPEQQAEVKRLLQDTDAPSMTLEEFNARVRKLLA